MSTMLTQAAVALKQKKDAADTATFARTASDSGLVRDDKKHVETLIKARTKWVATKTVAMEKLQQNKTLDYDAEMLEEMSHEKMIAMCKKYRLNANGTTEEVRTRLAELMMRERMRSRAYQKKQASAAGVEVEKRAEAIIEQYEMESIMHREEFAGLHGLEPHEQEALVKMEMKKSLGSVMVSSSQTRKALVELQAWHDKFEPIEPPSAHLTNVEQALAGMQPQDWMEMKERGYEGNSAVETKVADAIDEIRRKAKRLRELEKLIAQAKKDHAESARKLSALQHQHQRLQTEYERKTEEKESKQEAAHKAKHNAKVLKEQFEDEEGDWTNELRKLEKVEMSLQAEVDALQERYAKEIEALSRKHEEIEKHESGLSQRKNEKLMKIKADADEQFEMRKVEKLNEMLAQALAEEEAADAALHEQIAAEEAKMSDLAQKIKGKVSSKLALQGEILRLTQEASEAREAEEDAERAAKRNREMWKELEAERAEFEWYMKHIAPTAGQPPEEKGCQIGSDDGFDQPMIDGGAKVEAARLHFVGTG